LSVTVPLSLALSVAALVFQQAPPPATQAPATAAARGPTVGDTIWVSRRVAVPAGRAVRPPDWEPEGDVVLLGRPAVVQRGGTADVRWPLVAWRAGEHQVTVPGPLLLASNGIVDSLPDTTVTLVVRSVLPRGADEASLRPQPAAGVVPRLQRSLLPLLVLLVAATLLLLPLHLLWRRRGRPATPAAGGAAPAARPPLERWAEAGETHTVATVAATRLRSALARAVPAAHPGLDTESALAAAAGVLPQPPLGELADTLRALDAARFGPGSAAEVLELAGRAETLAAEVAR